MFKFLLKCTGLYFRRNEKNSFNLPNCFAILRISFLFLASLFGCLISIKRSLVYILYSLETASLDTFQGLGWHLQTLSSTIFLIYWQWNGTLEALYDKILLKNSVRLKRWSRVIRIVILISLSIILFNTSRHVVTNVIREVNNRKDSYGQIIIRAIRHLFVLQYAVVENITFCIFMISIGSLAIELSDFNHQLSEEFTTNRSSKIAENKVITAHQMLTHFKSYTQLTDKVGIADKIFNLYIFTMMACSLPTAIFAPINLIHSEWNIDLLFNTYDVLSSFYKLCGLCILPAQVFTQLKFTHSILNRQIPNWSEEDKRLTRTIKIFADSIAQSSDGITVGGMTVITKSMILTCLSMIVPYIVLCLQLKIGSQNGVQSKNMNQTNIA